MSFLYRNETSLDKMKESIFTIYSTNSWMSLLAGEGEEEIENHGWSRVKSFSQETEARGQQTPRIGAHRPKLKSLKRRMRTDSQTQLPNFSSLKNNSGADHVGH